MYLSNKRWHFNDLLFLEYMHNAIYKSCKRFYCVREIEIELHPFADADTCIMEITAVILQNESASTFYRKFYLLWQKLLLW